MSRHEIEIEGLPEGWEPVGAKVGCPSTAGGDLHVNAKIFIKRKVRKYDHSKTLDDVLVYDAKIDAHYPAINGYPEDVQISQIWQPNIHGKCPVDGEVCIVRVKRANGRDTEEMLASTICWDFGFGAATIVAYQFIRLADGREF